MKAIIPAAAWRAFTQLILTCFFPLVAHALSGPTDVSATKTTNIGFVQITWKAIDAITNYEIWRGIGPELTGAVLSGTNDTTTTNFLDFETELNRDYYYWVRGSSDSGFTDFSGPVVGSQNWQKWTRALAGAVNGPAALGANRTIYVTSRGVPFGKLYAFDSIGNKVWEYEADSYITTPASLSPKDGTIYFGCSNGKLYAIDPNGSLKWTNQRASFPRTMLAVGNDGTVYVPSLKEFVAVSPEGKTIWTQAFDSTVYCPPSVGADGTIYLEHILGALRAFNPAGDIKWTYSPGHSGVNPFTATSIDSDGTLYFGLSAIIYALAPDKTLKWSYTNRFQTFRTPVITQDHNIVFITSRFMVNEVGQGGKLNWQFTGPHANDDPSDPTILADGSILVLFPGIPAKMVVLNSDGTLRSMFDTGKNGDSEPPLVGPDGSIYKGYLDGTFSAYAGSAGLAASAWPALGHDNGRTANVAASSSFGPKLQLSGGLDNQGTVVLSVNGLVAGQWVLETASNLVQWEILESFSNAAPAIQFSEPVPAEGSRFYRIRSK
jgi:hypothetical protein